jgi:hypothetical protein
MAEDPTTLVHIAPAMPRPERGKTVAALQGTRPPREEDDAPTRLWTPVPRAAEEDDAPTRLFSPVPRVAQEARAAATRIFYSPPAPLGPVDPTTQVFELPALPVPAVPPASPPPLAPPAWPPQPAPESPTVAEEFLAKGDAYQVSVKPEASSDATQGLPVRGERDAAVTASARRPKLGSPKKSAKEGPRPRESWLIGLSALGFTLAGGLGFLLWAERAPGGALAAAKVGEPPAPNAASTSAESVAAGAIVPVSAATAVQLAPVSASTGNRASEPPSPPPVEAAHRTAQSGPAMPSDTARSAAAVPSDKVRSALAVPSDKARSALEAQAVQHVKSGRRSEALGAYRELVALVPDERAFVQAVRILEQQVSQGRAGEQGYHE